MTGHKGGHRCSVSSRDLKLLGVMLGAKKKDEGWNEKKEGELLYSSLVDWPNMY